MANKKDSKKQISIQPLGDRVLVRPMEKKESEKKSEAGIIIPKSSEEENVKRGEVIAVGSGKRDENGEVVPMEVKEGDKVLFKEFAGDSVNIDNEEYYIISETGLLAAVK